jgi:hypothetical protein
MAALSRLQLATRPYAAGNETAVSAYWCDGHLCSTRRLAIGFWNIRAPLPIADRQAAELEKLCNAVELAAEVIEAW